MIRAAAALETLHLFALVHDDVMDASTTRRGRPSAHVESVRLAPDGRRRRRPGRLRGEPRHPARRPRAHRRRPPRRRSAARAAGRLVRALRRADRGPARRFTGAAAGRRDRPPRRGRRAAEVGEVLDRPAAAARRGRRGRPARTRRGLLASGDRIGRAFTLRDDYLGVWATPRPPGSPPATTCWRGSPPSCSLSPATASPARTPPSSTGVGTSSFAREDVPRLADAMRRAGVEAEVERMIAAAVRDAEAAWPPCRSPPRHRRHHGRCSARPPGGRPDGGGRDRSRSSPGPGYPGWRHPCTCWATGTA